MLDDTKAVLNMKKFYKNRRFFNVRKTPLFTKFINTGARINTGALSSIGQNYQISNNKAVLSIPAAFRKENRKKR